MRAARPARTKRGMWTRSGILSAAIVQLAVIAAVAVHAPGARAATTFRANLTRAPYLTDLVALHVNVNWATDQSATTGSLEWGPVTGGTCTLPNVMTATHNAASITVRSQSTME